MVLLHGLKMIRLPEDKIKQVEAEVLKYHIKEVEDVESLKMLQSKEFFDQETFRTIIQYIFQLIAESAESAIPPQPIPQDNFLQITFVKSNPKEQNFTLGKSFNITSEGFDHQLSERKKGTKEGEVYIGRHDPKNVVLNDLPF